MAKCQIIRALCPRGLERIRTAVRGFADHCLATRPRDQKIELQIYKIISYSINFFATFIQLIENQ